MTLVTTNYPSFSSLFDEFFNTEMSDWKRHNYSDSDTTLPKVNVKEDDHGFEVEMAAPGMKKSDFNIKLEDNVLSISSEKTDDKEDDKVNYSRKEFSYQSFFRSFNLPDIADSNKVKASYENGILKISIPKKEEAKPRPPKMISVS